VGYQKKGEEGGNDEKHQPQPAFHRSEEERLVKKPGE